MSRSSPKSDQTVGTNEVIRQRKWRSTEEKRQIAEATLEAGASVAAVAQTYGVHPSQVGKWRRLYQCGKLGNGSAPALLAVQVSDATAQEKSVGGGRRPARSLGATDAGMIQIEFARARVSIEGSADAATVRAVLECLAE